ncbi:MAG: DUF6468 domain-containing protein [Geminicoccaceae bacterium]
MVDTALQLVLIALLLITIGYCWLVHRRLALFRNDRHKLEAFVTALDLTIRRAEAAIRKLKVATDSERSELDRTIHLAKQQRKMLQSTIDLSRTFVEEGQSRKAEQRPRAPDLDGPSDAESDALLRALRAG